MFYGLVLSVILDLTNMALRNFCGSGLNVMLIRPGVRIGWITWRLYFRCHVHKFGILGLHFSAGMYAKCYVASPLLSFQFSILFSGSVMLTQLVGEMWLNSRPKHKLIDVFKVMCEVPNWMVQCVELMVFWIDEPTQQPLWHLMLPTCQPIIQHTIII